MGELNGRIVEGEHFNLLTTTSFVDEEDGGNITQDVFEGMFSQDGGTATPAIKIEERNEMDVILCEIVIPLSPFMAMKMAHRLLESSIQSTEDRARRGQG